MGNKIGIFGKGQSNINGLMASPMRGSWEADQSVSKEIVKASALALAVTKRQTGADSGDGFGLGLAAYGAGVGFDAVGLFRCLDGDFTLIPGVVRLVSDFGAALLGAGVPMRGGVLAPFGGEFALIVVVLAGRKRRAQGKQQAERQRNG